MGQSEGKGSKIKEPPPPKLTPPEREKMLKRRAAIAQEILDTERSYTESLGALVHVFMQPLLERDLIRPQKVQTIFSNIQDIYTVHEELLAELNDRMQNWNSNTILSDLFLKRTEVLKMYTTYINNYNASMAMVAHCMNKTKFVEFLEQAQENPACRRLDLASFLIMPIQRLPRYILLLEDLSKHTPGDHKDYKGIRQALAKMKQLADFVNEAKRVAEMMQRLLEIQESISGAAARLELVDPERRLLSEGDLAYFQSPRDRKPAPLHYFLCNDLILLCTPSTAILNRKVRFKLLEGSFLTEAEVKDLTDSDDRQNALEIVTMNGSYVVTLPSREEKEKWIKDFYMTRSKAPSGAKRREFLIEQVKRQRSDISIAAAAPNEKTKLIAGADAKGKGKEKQKPAKSASKQANNKQAQKKKNKKKTNKKQQQQQASCSCVLI